MAIQGQDITYNINQLQDLLDKVNNLGDATTETAGLMSAEDKQKVDNAITQETDPTVPSWAKASDKPSYSASEVGAVPTTRKVNNKALSADVTLSASDVGALPSDTELFSGSYDDLTDKPTIPAEQIQSDWNQSNTSAKDYIKNKPTIPDSLSDLSDDSTHRVVTDTEKSTWSAKSDFSGSYNDLTDKPTIPAAQVQSDWSEADDTKVDYIKNKPSLATVAISGSYSDLSNKPTIPDAQVQTDWSESDNTKVDYIKNKPTLGVGSSSGAASSSTIIGIPAGGNAGQVLYKVDGSTDYSVGWTNQTQNYPSAYCTTSGSTAAKKASCTLYAAQANSYLHVLIGSNNTSASALTLNVNSEGAKPIYINGTASSATNYTLPKGTYIVFYDGTNYYFRTDGKIQAPNGTLVQTNSTTGLLKNDGTVDTTSYGTYSKPSGGIPAADLASGVIPTVPTISTDISSDAASDTKTTSPKAVKTFVEGKGYTTNTGTITSVKMNGSTVASSGEADLGTVITDISSKQDVIDSSHKLSADLISDGTTNKVYTATEQSKLSGIATGAEVNVQANWNESDSSSDAYIQNKPTIPTVPSNIVTGSSQSYTIWSGTQAQYDALATKDNNTIYLIKES